MNLLNNWNKLDTSKYKTNDYLSVVTGKKAIFDTEFCF